MLCCYFRIGNNRVVGRPVAGGEEDGRVCEKLAEAPCVASSHSPKAFRRIGSSNVSVNGGLSLRISPVMSW